MFSYEGSGKTVEKAIEDALLHLRASRDDVDIKILDTGGLFRKAKVLVEISDDCKEEYKKKREKLQKFIEEEERQSLIENQCQSPIKEQPEVVCQTLEEKCEPKIEEVVEQNSKEQKNCKQPKCDCKKEKIEKQQVCKSEAELGQQFLQGFLKSVNIDGQVLVEQSDEEIFYTIKGDDVASLIGYRGECLNSLQFLTSVINGKASRKCKKVRLDIDGYREKRKNTLTALAHRMCKKVQKTGHSTRLEPMSAYERRIIHTIVAEQYPDLESVSKGEEPHRYLIIKSK